jgi:hypothetical protein
MADQSHVETALVALTSAALYPQGTGSASVAGLDCRIYRGWPNSAALDNDLRNNVINVTVFPSHGSGRLTTRYVEEWVGSPAQPTLTASVSGVTVTFAGSADPGQVAGILVDGQSYAYRTQAGDTPASVAANIAVLARATRIVPLFGTSITLTGAGELRARVVADAPVQKEVRRQEQVFQVTCWCPTPATRDTAAAAIDQALAALSFIDLDDGTQGRLLYSGTTVFDQSEDALLYRRDLLYSVEYATILTSPAPAMLFGDLQLNAATFTV